MQSIPSQAQVRQLMHHQPRPGGIMQSPGSHGMNPNPGANPSNMKPDQMNQSAGVSQPPHTPQQSHQQAEPAPSIAPAHAGNAPPNNGMIGGPGSQDGRHSAPATANPSPGINANPGSMNGTGASPANNKGQPSPAGPTDVNPGGGMGVNGIVPRPNTAPMTMTDQGLPSANLDLFDMGALLGGSSLSGTFEGLEQFVDIDNWLNPN